MLFTVPDCLEVSVTIARNTTQFDNQKLNLIRERLCEPTDKAILEFKIPSITVK